MFRTPRTPRKLRPRGAKSEEPLILPVTSAKDEQLEKPDSVCSVTKKSVKTVATSSTSARRRKLELEVATAKAKLQMEAAEVEAQAKAEAAVRKAEAAEAEAQAKADAAIRIAEAAEAEAQAKADAAIRKAEIQVELLEKQLAVDIAELESQSSRKSSVASVTDKISNWFDKSAEPEWQTHKTEAVSDIKLLACAIKDAVTDSSTKQHQQLLTRLATSKDLPLYFGDPMEWMQFKEAYQQSTVLCKYTDTENVWRLRKALRGEAKDTVSSLLIGGTAPEVIIDTLELRFGQPEGIMTRIMAQLKKLQPLSPAYHSEIVAFAIKIKNYVTTAKALKQNDYLRSPELVSIILSKLPTVLLTKWTDFIHEKRHSEPRLEKLCDFIFIEATKTAASGVSFTQIQLPKRKPDERQHKHHTHSIFTTHSSEPSDMNKCKFCRTADHKLPTCPRFKRAMRRDRWRFARNNNLCYKCLLTRHTDTEQCTANNCDIDGCQQPHHRLLHWTKSNQSKVEKESDTDVNNETVNHNTSYNTKTLLKIVPLTVHGPAGSIHTHALLDDGATVTLMASDLADKLELHGRKQKMRARSAWDDGELVCETQLIDFEVSNYKGEKYSVHARKVKSLNLPVQILPNIDFSRYNLTNSDFSESVLCSCNAQPMLLIGQDNHHLTAPVCCYRSEQREPYVTKTPLGWCVHGSSVSDVTLCPDPYVSVTHECYDNSGSVENVFHLCSFQPVESISKVNEPCLPTVPLDKCICTELHEEVRKHFLFDSLGVGTKPRPNPDHERAVAILDHTSKLRDGQWCVGLPWKSDDIKLPDSYPNAFKRLKSVQRKMLTNPDYASRYQDRITHLLSNGYAREVLSTDECNDRLWYLPHFGVDNPNKSKLRLVFDAAAKTDNYCLNDYLLQGPDLLQKITGIMLRFRENSIGIIGDIEDMFLRIKIRDEDMHALRFIWQDVGFLPHRGESLGSNDNPGGSSPPKDDQIKQYVMTSLVFGANCSPFIAQYINQIKNTQRFEQTMPDAVHAIRSNQYMDNFIDSVPDVCTATKMIREVSSINEKGDFKMRDWLSNNLKVLSDTPKEILSDKAVRFNIENQSERTLGLLWFPEIDTFAFDLSLKRIPKEILEYARKPTKRELLSIIMSIFDLHGFLAPFTVKSKIIMQEVWKLGIKWDDQITDKLFIQFQDWLKQLKTIGDIRIPRWYFRCADDSAAGAADTASGSETTLHCLCDASPRVFACVAFWRRKDDRGRVCVSLIASKCRVAPLKSVTIPRLELQGAVLACRLAETIKKEHRIKPVATYYWTDSTVVLHWIKNEHRDYKVFIANRLGEIDELSKVHEWNYVPTELNIADIATKITDYNLHSNSTWFTGPSFLHEPPECWPRQPETLKNINKDILEEKINTVCDTHNDACDLPVPNPERFSSWLRLLRCAATVLLFIAKSRKNNVQHINEEFMKKAELLLLRHSQAQSFRCEIDLLNKNKGINRDSRLRFLTPFIDGDGLLRVGGRINAARDVDERMKNPIILDGRHRLARLLVKHHHERVGHSFNELVVNELRQTYWIVNIRPTVRTVASQCLVCRMRKATPKPPRLGNLPAERLAHHQRPFTMCGVDLFGPIEVTVGRQRQKRYGVLFTCLTVRAVHIEIVPTLTADSLIMSLRRMAARRGWPSTIISDNGTNLRGANVELRKSFQELDQTRVESDALNKGVTWKFLAPASPHMGGAWERLIQTTKKVLKIVLKERAPREEILTTFLAEVENIINSRPLTHVSVEPHSRETLTPNHFLLGSSSNMPIPGVFNDSDLSLKRQWRIAQRLSDMFWNRWVKEILPILVPRTKWHQEGQQLKVGDLVLVMDPTSPRNYWPKGVVEKVYPGEDGRVRVVDIRTGTGVMKRPSARVVLLRLNNDESRNDDTRGEGVDDAHAAPPTQ